MASPQVHVFADAQQVAQAAAERFVAAAAAAIRATGRFSVALAGGSTPQRAYELLADQPLRAQVDWAHVHLFFGDERCVPPTDPQSNFRMASLALLDHVGLPPRNVHRMIGEADPSAAASVYEAELRVFFAAQPWPAFDLLLLGMGDDGHTASLFPGSAALKEQQRWVVANRVEKFQAFRLTLSPPAINAARHILFSVTGPAKAQRLQEVLHGPRDPMRLPSQLISPTGGNLEWLLDKAAAGHE
jgi:6-phosphogluconolactonase